MKMTMLTGLVLLTTAACSGAHTTGGDQGDESIAQLKKAAAEARADGNAHSDVCGESGWYGDGECDSFCQDYDSVDCAPAPGGVMCALFVEEANGFCSRVPNDPCMDQDPDCGGQTAPGTPVEPIVCTLISQLPDGVCEPDPADPCIALQDPDCSSSGGGTPSNPGIVCTLISQLPNGVCEPDPADPCIALQDPDCSSSGGDTPSNPGSDDPGVPGSTEPALPVACAEYLELSDGVCKRDAADPCIFQDPDCTVK